MYPRLHRTPSPVRPPSLEVHETVIPRGRERDDTNPQVYLSYGRALWQDPHASSFNSSPTRSAARNNSYIGSMPPEVVASPSKHALKRQQLLKRWESLIPTLIPGYMELLRNTNNLRLLPALDVIQERCTCCQSSRELTIEIVRFNKYESVKLWASDCNPAANQLIRSGLFPCAPKRPTLAVDIHMLDFVNRLFLRVSPNHTAWCGAVEDYLQFQGYKLQGQDPLRRRFGNALHWFNSLQAATEQHIHSLLLHSRTLLLEGRGAPDRVPGEGDELPRVRRRAMVEEVEDEELLSGAYSRKRTRDDDNDDEACTPQNLSRPSEYLRGRCPVCFGGQFDPEIDRLNWTDVIVCLDACFTQRHNSQPRDPARRHPDSFFLAQSEVEEVEAHVNAAREKVTQPPKRARKDEEVEEEDDRLESGMLVSKGVLDLCGGSFKAAHEFLAKVIPKGSDVTGVMALLCRHDRPLWVVNMTTPGERQHYAIALMEKLFKNLPSYVTVGLLYDIACHLERSCLKWGLLEPYMDNLVFAISVFHVFGHQWACQLIYHPRKCERFGLSDGEGAERLWHAIQHLIAYTRIAGYHLRIYTLDTQFHFINNENLRKMGSWIRRKEPLLENKWTQNEKELTESGQSRSALRKHWLEQVNTQTRPLPSQSKNKGKNAVLECMRLRRAQKALEGRMKHLQEIIGNPDSADYEVATAEADLPKVMEDYEKKTQTLRKKEKALGVGEKSQLHHLVNSVYINKSMNARAVMVRLRERLRACKFELERLERSYRKQRSDQRLDEHTENSVKRHDPGIQELARKYNQIVREMKQLIILRRAPRNAVAPHPIDTSTLFNLDVDDTIWQDIGLNYDEEEENRVPPPWQADENAERLKVERRAMQTWMVEEWEVLDVTINRTDDVNIRHQLQQRERYLCRLCVIWQDVLADWADEWEDFWGPSVQELQDARQRETCAAVDIIEDDGPDAAFEQDVDPVLVEQLETVALADEYRSGMIDETLDFLD
ncbi:hypothetical protein K435DRAFT_874226 [Dendrothele bispora CBS 962.96]|uniref:CxC1-like cysteine cluster associated with KDZ transposases domain-containing protein n=1 Tax=Dendrothele bispora (strain CBS 962.96) TaxID=1314807 RepID=A0A4S8KX65_DENBC|nr:hypothetical protein K435DRAFT_874226 [Dendrothele bispora CBS 962.96]